MPSVFFDHATIDAWIAEDAPLLDLTTHLLAVGGQSARISFTVRGDTVAACTEEAARLVQHCGGQVQSCVVSGTRVAPGTVLLVATGAAAGLLRAWKVAQNLLEYACGVAGATARMVQAVQAVAPGVAVLTTRKHAPGLRRIALKATLSGGAFPHRLGLGETVLVFPLQRPPPCRPRSRRRCCCWFPCRFSWSVWLVGSEVSGPLLYLHGVVFNYNTSSVSTPL